MVSFLAQLTGFIDGINANFLLGNKRKLAAATSGSGLHTGRPGTNLFLIPIYYSYMKNEALKNLEPTENRGKGHPGTITTILGRP